MPGLAEIQSRVRQALVVGDAASVESLLAGGALGRRRFEIHRRHYETTLVNALVEKFPGSGWLAGTPFVAEAARQFVHQHPPQAPCIAEYGGGFPRFLGERPAAERVPYLREFAELEWHLGHVAIAVEEPALPAEEFSAIPAESLPDAKLWLQNGVRYLQAAWPVDELMKLYLADTTPDYFEFDPEAVTLEIRGARGEFSIARLETGEFVLRKSIQEGRSIGDAAECALDADANFDPATALAGIITSGLVIALKSGAQE